MSNNTEYKPTDYDPFDGDFGNSDDKIFSDKMVKSRKDYLCSHCFGKIDKGQIYRNLTAKFDGEIRQFRWCPDCCTAMVQEMKNWDNENKEDFDNDFEEFPFESRLNLFK